MRWVFDNHAGYGVFGPQYSKIYSLGALLSLGYSLPSFPLCQLAKNFRQAVAIALAESFCLLRAIALAARIAPGLAIIASENRGRVWVRGDAPQCHGRVVGAPADSARHGNKMREWAQHRQ